MIRPQHMPSRQSDSQQSATRSTIASVTFGFFCVTWIALMCLQCLAGFGEFNMTPKLQNL